MKFSTLSGMGRWILYCGGPVAPDGFRHDDDATGWILYWVGVRLSRFSLTEPGAAVEDFDAIKKARDALWLEIWFGDVLFCRNALRDLPDLKLDLGFPTTGASISIRLAPEVVGSLPTNLRCMISIGAQPARQQLEPAPTGAWDG